MTEEVWILASGFSNYEVTASGRIRNKSGATLNPKPNKRSGYVKVTLRGGRRPLQESLHALIAKTFVPNPDNKPIVNHINGIKHDNRASNLEWVTSQENAQRKVFPNAGRNRSRVVAQLSEDDAVIAIWESITAAAQGLGLLRENISKCCNRRQRTAGGWKWKFGDEIEAPDPSEEWKDLEFEGRHFEVSSLGRIRLPSGQVTTGSTREGYKIVCGRFRIHRLVALAYCPNPENKPYVNHINGSSVDNAASNLEWVTPKENAQHAVRTGLRLPGNVYARPVRQLTSEGEEVCVHASMAVACRATGAAAGNLTMVCRGQRPTAGGFRWEYADQTDDAQFVPGGREPESSPLIPDDDPLWAELGL